MSSKEPSNSTNPFTIESLKEICTANGFELFGITKTELKPQDRNNISEWIDKKYYGNMKWFPERKNLLLDFQNLGFEPKSAIVLGKLYLTADSEPISKKFPFHWSKYALGKDYHKVLREKGSAVLQFLRQTLPNFSFRQTVDSVPIPEKVLGSYAGIGWIGKNTMLINETYGSFFFLSTILSNFDFTTFHESIAGVDRCGTCRKCLDACPTGALFEEYKIDANLCISHSTIEDKTINPKLDHHGWAYGCDICQDVCPWNTGKRKDRMLTNEKDFEPLGVFQKNTLEFLNVSESEFTSAFQDSAVQRISFEKFQNNLSRAVSKKNLDS